MPVLNATSTMFDLAPAEAIPCTSKGKHNTNIASLLHNRTHISVGNEFQVPATSMTLCDKKAPPDQEYPDRDECLWRPTDTLQQKCVDEYCKKAQEQFNINVERSLLILLCSSHDLKASLEKVSKRKVINEWFSLEDTLIFRNAYSCFGKQFHKIRQMMPHKSLCALVEHYYKTKKNQQYRSFYDPDNFSDSSEADEKMEEKIDPKAEYHTEGELCQNCRNLVKKLSMVNGLNVCRACRLYFKSMNHHRICDPVDNGNSPSFQYKCPPDMEQIVKEFEEMAQPDESNTFYEDTDDSGDLQIEKQKLTRCQVKVREVESAINRTKAEAGRLEAEVKEESNKFSSSSTIGLLNQARDLITSFPWSVNGTKIRYSHQWTAREESAALHALIRFGDDFQIVSEILGTKTPDMVKGLYVRHKDLIQEKTNAILEGKPNGNDAKAGNR